MELNTDIDIKHLPLGEESSQEVESALTIINAIPDIDIKDWPDIDIKDWPDIDIKDWPDIDIKDWPDIDITNLPVIDVEGIGNTIKADVAHRGVDSHKLRINKSGASRVKTGVFRGHK